MLGTLALMSFIMVWLAVERFLYLRNVALDSFEDEEQLGIALTRHLTTISTIGANAPYIGLLGTVLGITTLRASLAIDPLSTATEEDLTAPLADLVEALLPAAPA